MPMCCALRCGHQAFDLPSPSRKDMRRCELVHACVHVSYKCVLPGYVQGTLTAILSCSLKVLKF